MAFAVVVLPKGVSSSAHLGKFSSFPWIGHPGGSPAVENVRTICRPEWLEGERANADLHHIHFDKRNDVLMIANSRMDCIDVVDRRGRMVDRRYLWDLSPEIMDLGLHRANRVPDICHLNHINELAGEILLTLGNLNATRRGALMSYRTGELLVRDLAFPHDGQLIANDVFAMTEAEGGCLTLFPGVRSSADLASAKRETFAANGNLGFPPGKLWIRGFAECDGTLLVGCSQFDENGAMPSRSQPTHLRLFRNTGMEVLGCIDLPNGAGFVQPVIYSILPYESEVSGFDPLGSRLLRPIRQPDDEIVTAA